MSSPPRRSREEERRLNIRTLVIASAASASAALVTSRLWIAGTWIAAALTPVIVALVSELLNRPTDRIARSITSDRPALQPDEAAPPPRSRPAAEPAAADRVAERIRRRPDHALPDPDAPPHDLPAPAARLPAPPAPTSVYRSEGARARPRRKIAYGVVFGTAALAFVIGVLVLTLPELVAGGSVGDGDRSTTLFGRSKKSEQQDTTQPQQTTPSEETEQQPTQPTTTEQQTTPTTGTTTTPTTTEQQTTPQTTPGQTTTESP